MTDESSVPADALFRLLEENRVIGPAFIDYSEKAKTIGLDMPLLNEGGITPPVLRAAMTDFMGYAQKARTLATAATAAKPPHVKNPSK